MAVLLLVVRATPLLLFFVIASWGCTQQGSGGGAPKTSMGPGSETAARAAPTSDTPAGLAGRAQPTVLVFFATWCDACSHKLATVKRARSEVSGTELFLISVDDEATRHHVPGFLREHRLVGAQVMDGLAHPDFVARYNPAGVIPLVVVLGTDGQPIDAQFGLRSGDRQRLEQSLRLALLD